MKPISPNSRTALIDLVREMPELSYREYQKRLENNTGHILGLGTIFRAVREVAGPQLRPRGRKRNRTNAGREERLKLALSQMWTNGILGVRSSKTPILNGVEYPTACQVLFFPIKSLASSQALAPSGSHLDVMIVLPENDQARLAFIWRHRNREPLNSYKNKLLRAWQEQILTKVSHTVYTKLNIYGSRVITRLIQSNKSEFFPRYYCVTHDESRFSPLHDHLAARETRFWLSTTISSNTHVEGVANASVLRTRIELKITDLWKQASII